MRDYLKIAIKASLLAGEKVLDIYKTHFSIKYKKDRSPVTLADKESQKIISLKLRQTGLPVLGEEEKEVVYHKRKKWEYFWIVDPLDGTKEFIKKNGEFTINIALIKEKKPVLGVVFVPAKSVLYFSAKDIGAYKIKKAEMFLNKKFNITQLINEAIRLPEKKIKDTIIIAVSRTHCSPDTKEFVESLKNRYKKTELIILGSALKLCLVAEGKAHVYPRFGPTMEWDIAAGQAIIEESGGKVIIHNSKEPLNYNKKKLVNPWFTAWGQPFK